MLSATRSGLIVLVVAALGALNEGWLTLPGIAALYLPPPLAWCVVRWRRMADEPAAFPVGRLAR
jgi:uncharacterized membrane protein